MTNTTTFAPIATGANDAQIRRANQIKSEMFAAWDAARAAGDRLATALTGATDPAVASAVASAIADLASNVDADWWIRDSGADMTVLVKSTARRIAREAEK